MENLQDHQILIEQINSPAFLVKNGVITAVNRRAAQYMAEIGTDIASILTNGQEEYREFKTGCIFLNISLCGVTYTCSVTQLQTHQLFAIEENTTYGELQALSLAAQQLCIPLSEISLMIETLNHISSDQKAKISQNLHKLQRIIGNMSDAEHFISAVPKMATFELCAIFEEILEKAKTLLLKSSITLSYTLPTKPVYSLAEPEIIKRAVYNLISNAAKFTPAGKSIDISLKQAGNRLYFSVTNGSHTAQGISGNIFQRYTRPPGLEDPRFGLGLGMTVVRAAAAAHGGTVLAEQTQNHHIKITMTLAIQKNNDHNVRSPILIPDLYGGRDQALIELSDILPYQAYMD